MGDSGSNWVWSPLLVRVVVFTCDPESVLSPPADFELPCVTKQNETDKNPKS